MTNSAFGRLVQMYQRSMLGLFRGSLLEMFAHPELMDTPDFQAATWHVAVEMARQSAKANAVSWRQAAVKSTKAREIYQALRKEVEGTHIGAEVRRIALENARLISSVPREVGEHIALYGVKAHVAGKRAGEIEAEIRKLAPQLVKNKVQLLARTQLSTAETQLTQVRSEQIGIRAYVWETSQDQRVRESHRKMNSVIVFWEDPPAPEALVGQKSTLGHYHCGCCPQCRCVALPLADLSEVQWPHKVYRNGAIKMTRRADFVKQYQLPVAA